MLLLGLIEFVSLIGIPVTLIGFVIQAIRKKPSKKVWGAICIGFLAAMVVCVIVTPASSSDDTEITEVQASPAEELEISEPSLEETKTPIETEEAKIEPLIFSAEDLYNAGENYIGQEVSVQGTILEISEFSDMNGYYLYGTKGQGLVVWIYETEKSHTTGEDVTLTGIVQNIGVGQVEITVNAPTGVDSNSDTASEKSEAEVFAEDDGISVELAESIEAALAESEHSYKLHQVYNWTQIDDWANGERYTGWLDMEYVWVFYVSGDSLQSIRQQKGLAYIWTADE